MKRITIEAVKAAYAKTGAKASRFTLDDHRVSPFLAWCKANSTDFHWLEWAHVQCGKDYVTGFIDGSCGLQGDITLPTDPELYGRGVADGRAVASAIFTEPTP